MSQLNWRDILGWDEDHIDELRVTSFFYIREGNYAVAQKFCETLAILNPNNSYDQQALGALYLQIDDPMKALTFLDKADALDPNNRVIQINRIKAMLMLGYREEGLNLLSAFIPVCKDRKIASDAEALRIAYRM